MRSSEWIIPLLAAPLLGAAAPSRLAPGQGSLLLPRTDEPTEPVKGGKGPNFPGMGEFYAHDVPIAPDPLYEAGDNDCVINARMVSDKAEVGLRRWTVGYSASEGIDKDMFCHHWKWAAAHVGGKIKCDKGDNDWFVSAVYVAGPAGKSAAYTDLKEAMEQWHGFTGCRTAGMRTFEEKQAYDKMSEKEKEKADEEREKAKEKKKKAEEEKKTKELVDKAREEGLSVISGPDGRPIFIKEDDKAKEEGFSVILGPDGRPTIIKEDEMTTEEKIAKAKEEGLSVISGPDGRPIFID